MRESTGQTSIKFAEDCYRKRKTEVAERKHFPSREFDKIQFGELLDYWWHKHAKHKSSKFNYLLPRLQRFKKLKARTISSDMIQSFLFELRDTEELSATSANHYRTILNSTTCGTSESGLEGFAGWLKCRTLRIHDLRHYATTVLFMKGIPDSIISKMTGHRSRELKRYQHLTPLFKQQTVELIAQDLGKFSDTISGTPELIALTADAKPMKRLTDFDQLPPPTSDLQ